MAIRLTVNGRQHEVDVEPDTPLLWVLRDALGLTGTKYGCGIAQCGACTVHVDGVAMRSCMAAVGDYADRAHAAMEPLDAVARFENGTLEIWAGHQMPDLYQTVGAQIMGIDRANVKLHVMTPGGFFGRRAVPDADVIVEVVSVLKTTGARAPIKVLWTREDDMKGGRYRPMYYHAIKAGLDAEGNPIGWHHRIVGQSILAGTPFEKMLVKDSVDQTSVEGASNLPYQPTRRSHDLDLPEPRRCPCGGLAVLRRRPKALGPAQAAGAGRGRPPLANLLKMWLTEGGDRASREVPAA